MERVDAWMTQEPICVPENKPIPECALLMFDNRIRHLPVVDADGLLTGLLTDFEIFQRGWMAGSSWVAHDDADQWLLAGNLSRDAQVVCTEEQTFTTVLRMLLGTFQDAAVVVREGAPVGILTEHDVVRLAAKKLGAADTPSREFDPELLTVQREDAALTARSRMTFHRIRHVLVLDGEKLHGVLSFRDVAVESELDDVLCEDLLSFDPLRYSTGSTTLVEAAEIMAKHKIGCLPVVDEDGKPIQLITRSDAVHALAARLERTDG